MNKNKTNKKWEPNNKNLNNNLKKEVLNNLKNKQKIKPRTRGQKRMKFKSL